MAQVKLQKDTQTGSFTGKMLITFDANELATAKKEREAALTRNDADGKPVQLTDPAAIAAAERKVFERLVAFAQAGLQEFAQLGTADVTRIQAQINELEAKKAAAGTPDFGTIQ